MMNGSMLEKQKYSDFQNTEEGLKLLKNNVPEPFLAAVLSIWETSTETKRLGEMGGVG